MVGIHFNLKYFLILTPILFFIGCEKTIKRDTIFFGGQIKNPKGIHVYIFKEDTKVAETKLNQDHKFLFKLDSLKAGLYTFKHGQEYQYIYLEPKDSLLIRLNTWDFDESLVFSGKGAERNNFLIQLFLDNEQQEKLFYGYYRLNEAAFSKKIDSFKKLKNIQYKQFKEGTSKQSKKFNTLVNTSIYFPLYAKKEIYAIKNKQLNNLKKLPNLSQDFYDFRNDIDLKTNPFSDYYTFKNYLWNYLYNVAIYKKETDSLYQVSTLLLQQIAKKVTFPKLKNEMLQKTYYGSLLNDKCSKKDKEIAHRIFIENCTDGKRKKEINKLIAIIDAQKKGTPFPDIRIKNVADNVFNATNIITKNTVFYSWPKGLNQIKNMAKRVNYLTKKYPNIRFIGLDFQLDNYNWKAYIKATNLDAKNQFQLVNKNNNHIFSPEISSAVITDKNGVIVSGFTHLSYSNFEKKLYNLENNQVNMTLTKK